jgi:hypothetical protein
MDDRDPLCIHLLAYVDEIPVGTARIDIERGARSVAWRSWLATADRALARH